jgi:4-diphosphocytidyl-2-C-methyl-D-erythritol kinase
LSELLELKSCAKINLGLLLLNKRDDGYHDIATIFQEINLFDTLIFRRTEKEVLLECDNPDIPVNEDNLIWKAFDLCRKHYSIDGGISVLINKRIPAGGGLGGGSSNAAATLKAVKQLWSLDADTDELTRLAGFLGSDVPFFIIGGTAFGEGRGEKLKRIHIPADWFIVLTCPVFHISTQWAYEQAKIGLTNNKKFIKLASLVSRFDPEKVHKLLCNDLEKPVFARYPVLAGLKRSLRKYGAFYSAMSGSGSTVYGLYHTEQDAENAAFQIGSEFEMTAKVCRPVCSYSENA